MFSTFQYNSTHGQWAYKKETCNPHPFIVFSLADNIFVIYYKSKYNSRVEVYMLYVSCVWLK